MYLGILGVKDPVLEDIGRSERTSSKSYRNISRNFHRRLSKSGKVLPVKVSMERVWVRQQRPRVRQIQLAYPMIALRDWGELLLNSHPNLMLGGFSLKQVSEYTEMFTRFWTRYQHLDPSHPIYATHPESVRGRCIPFLVHGDEGRGKGKVPILIQSFQMLIGPKGEQTTNISGWL